MGRRFPIKIIHSNSFDIRLNLLAEYGKQNVKGIFLSPFSGALDLGHRYDRAGPKTSSDLTKRQSKTELCFFDENPGENATFKVRSNLHYKFLISLTDFA